MKTLDIARYVFSSSVAAALLAGCGGSQQPIGAPGALPQISSTTGSGYSVLYSFNDRHDGQVPKAGLTDMHGMLYGTTYGGGSVACNGGCGAVFKISTAGKEKVVYSFKGTGSNDGANPAAGLLSVKGALYGTTEYGGIPSSGGCNGGTVFRISASGAENVLYRFYGYFCHDHIYNDGANPVANLINVKGQLYGTTQLGGAAEYGTAFAMNTSGIEKLLYSFGLYTTGAEPVGSLIYVNRVFYGTTEYGGANAGTNAYCCGNVFSLSSTGTENVLYDFVFEPYSPNGALPAAGLINHDGTLYGTTSYSGVNGAGTAFSITPSGYLTTLHSFGAGADGSAPAAPLLEVKGKLYGTTQSGGPYGKGTIFSLSLTGTETVLHSFGYGSDGATPLAGLIDVKGTLYGTTSAGGTQGYGTVFALRIKP